MIERGGTAGAVLNAANEVAVGAFLERRIGFLDIASMVAAALEALRPTPVRSLADVLEADRETRRWAEDRLLGAAGAHSMASGSAGDPS